MEIFLWIFFGIGVFVTGVLVLRFVAEFLANFATKIITLFPKTRKRITLENARNNATHRQDVMLYDERKDVKK